MSTKFQGTPPPDVGGRRLDPDAYEELPHPCGCAASARGSLRELLTGSSVPASLMSRDVHSGTTERDRSVAAPRTSGAQAP